MEEVHVVAPEKPDDVGGGVNEVKGGALVGVRIVLARLGGVLGW